MNLDVVEWALLVGGALTIIGLVITTSPVSVSWVRDGYEYRVPITVTVAWRDLCFRAFVQTVFLYETRAMRRPTHFEDSRVRVAWWRRSAPDGMQLVVSAEPGGISGTGWLPTRAAIRLGRICADLEWVPAVELIP
jgi:hypothetical protein